MGHIDMMINKDNQSEVMLANQKAQWPVRDVVATRMPHSPIRYYIDQPEDVVTNQRTWWPIRGHSGQPEDTATNPRAWWPVRGHIVASTDPLILFSIPYLSISYGSRILGP